MTPRTLVLTGRDVAAVLDVRDCIDAVERALVMQAAGETIPAGVHGTHVERGGFHVKVAGLLAPHPVFVAKVNANFPGNPARVGLPTVQGVVALFDAGNGVLLALLDSAEITRLRTAATTAVAARHLARSEAAVVAICGCGEQGRSHLRALAAVRRLRTAHALDADGAVAARYAAEMSRELDLDVIVSKDLPIAARASDIVVTCTTARRWILGRGDVAAGAFVAAVGADHPEKQEIEPALMAASTVIADSIDQCERMGDLHHAIAAGLMTRADVAAELADVVSGRAAGRRREDEVIVFDSTGTALQDVAAAWVTYERARERGLGTAIELA